MKQKSIFKAVVAIAVALTFVLPGSATITNVGTPKSEQLIPVDNNLIDIAIDKVDNRATREGLPGDTVYDEHNDIMYVERDISVDDTTEEERMNIEWDNTPTESLPRGIIYVDDDNTEGPWNGTPEHPYQYIQDGIDNATAGDIIYVLNGIYYENVTVNKVVDLLGESRENTIIDADWEESNLEYVAAVDVLVSGVNISNFTMRNATWGIHMDSVSNNCIANCDSYDNPYFGIQLLYTSTNNKIINCTSYNNKHGITLYYASGNSIINCTSYNNHDRGFATSFTSKNKFINCSSYNNGYVGFDLQDTSYNTFINCTSYKNSAGFYLRAIFYNVISNEIINCGAHNNSCGMYIHTGFYFDGCLGYLINTTIINCDVYENTYGIDLCAVLDTKITSCNVYNNSIYGIRPWLTSDTKITKCDVYDNKQGVYLYHDYYSEIADSDFYGNQQGIYLEYSSNCNITNCNAYNNIGFAIGLTSSPDSNIANCDVHGNPGYGIYIYDSPNCNLRENSISNNAYNFGVEGEVSDFYQDIDASNTINGKPMYYLIEQSDMVLDETNNIGYLGLISCTNITAKNSDTFGVLLVDTTDSMILNVTSHNSIYGICPVYSSAIDIINCDAYNNRYGIRLYFASNITITNCTSSSNSKDGIYFWESTNNNITYCSSYKNHQYGIYLGYGSSFNLIYHNNFVNNIQNAYDACSNIWNDSYPSGGNYWSDYTGVDNFSGPGQNISGSDGIGDTPYNISGGDNQDKYPLMVPVDETPPVIIGIMASPEVQNSTEPVNITCTVIDNIAVDTVKVNISGPEGFTLEETMNMNESVYYYEDVYATFGVYEYFIWANDTFGNEAVSGIYSFKITDLEIPVSSVNALAEWQDEVPFTITATASDNTGVVNVTLYYRYSSDEVNWTDWASYGIDEEEPWSWSFTGVDGYYQFYSIAVDDYGNVEDPPSTADASTGIDTEDPVTTHTLSGTMGGYDWYVSDVTVTLSATDNLSGVDSTWYKIDSGYWSLYSAPFTVSSEGEHTVCYYSFDNAGNQEEAKSVDLKIDKTPPVTTHEFNGVIGKEGWFVSDVNVTLSATDALSGVNYTKYKVDDDEWTTYVESFVVTEDGDHTLYYYSVDLAGNIESTNEADFKIEHDTVPPVTTHEFYGTMGDNNWYKSNVVVTLTAEDDSAGVDYTMYRLDEEEWAEYEGAFPVTEDANHTLCYYSVDRVGNEEPVNEVELKIDQTDPTINFTVEKIGFRKWLLTASVSDETSGVARVEFYLDGEYLGNATEPPYEWVCTKKGTAQAVVYDNAGNEAISDPVPVSKGQSQSQSSGATPVQRSTMNPEINVWSRMSLSSLDSLKAVLNFINE